MHESASPAISVAELAARLGGELSGAGAALVRDVAPLADAGPTDVSWCGKRDYLKALGSARAAVVLIPRDWEVASPAPLIRVGDPDLAICDVLRWLAPPADEVPVGVHASAVVDATAEVSGAAIGPLVTVGAGAVVGAGSQLHAGVRIGRGARVGRGCVLWPNVVIREYCELGDRVVIHPNATIGADGFGFLQRGGQHVKIPQVGRVVIEDDVEIGASTTVDRARSGETRIGRGTKIDNQVQIGHNCRVGPHCILVGGSGLSGSVTLGTGVTIAAGAGAADHVHVGDGAIITGLSGVSADVPAGAVYRGAAPAVPIQEFQRQYAAVRRLPKYVDLLRELKRRVEELESAADDRARS